MNKLALNGITSVEAANRFIAETCLPAHNLRFAVAAAEPGSAFVACPPEACRDVLCRRETRQVGNDNTVAWRGRRLQIPPRAPAPLRAALRHQPSPTIEQGSDLSHIARRGSSFQDD